MNYKLFPYASMFVFAILKLPHIYHKENIQISQRFRQFRCLRAGACYTILATLSSKHLLVQNQQGKRQNIL